MAPTPNRVIRKRSKDGSTPTSLNDGLEVEGVSYHTSFKSKTSEEEGGTMRERSYDRIVGNLEITGTTDDDNVEKPWSEMVVRHSQELSGDASLIENCLTFVKSTKGFVILAAVMFLLIVGHNRNDDVEIGRAHV